MTDATQRGDEREFRLLNRDELTALAGEELPEGAAMSLVEANVAIPTNAAVAAEVLSDDAVDDADAAQTTPIASEEAQRTDHPDGAAP